MQRCPTLLCLLFSLAPVFPKKPLSQPDYRDRLKVEYVRVPMRDGVELAAKIVRPDAEGRFSRSDDVLSLPLPQKSPA